MPNLDIQITTHGRVGASARRHAEEKVARVVKLAPRPILFAHVELIEEANPATERPSIAKATLDASGRLVRAHVAGPDMLKAVDLLEERLRSQLERLSERRRTRRHETGVAEPGNWRHGDLPTARPAYFPRPVEERELVRHKTFALDAASPEEAAFDMDALDYDFYLFMDATTGDDSLVYRRPDGAPGLIQLRHRQGEHPGPPFELEPVLPAEISVGEAIARLNLTGEPFVFFVDRESGRGTVLYRRYDGHYGLIAPGETS